jgi:hypothetical protein
VIDSHEVVARVAAGLGVASVPTPMTRTTVDRVKKIGMIEVLDCPQSAS